MTEQQPNFQQQNYFNQQVALPNSTAVLVLGIISIVGCVCYGVVGAICGIIALVLASKDRKRFNASPEIYTDSSYKNLNAGRVCAIIGTIISAIYLLFVIALIFIMGLGVLSDPNTFKNLTM